MKLINKQTKKVIEQPVYGCVAGIRVDNIEFNKLDFNELLKLKDDQLRGVLTMLSMRFRVSTLGQFNVEEAIEYDLK